MEKKKKILIGVGIGIAGAAIFAAGCIVGKRIFIEKLISKDMTNVNVNDILWPALKSVNKKNGGLIFEIKAECIGD